MLLFLSFSFLASPGFYTNMEGETRKQTLMTLERERERELSTSTPLVGYLVFVVHVSPYYSLCYDMETFV